MKKIIITDETTCKEVFKVVIPLHWVVLDTEKKPITEIDSWGRTCDIVLFRSYAERAVEIITPNDDTIHCANSEVHKGYWLYSRKYNIVPSIEGEVCVLTFVEYNNNVKGYIDERL